MLYWHAVDRRALQQRINALRDGMAIGAGGKSADQWIAALLKARGD